MAKSGLPTLKEDDDSGVVQLKYYNAGASFEDEIGAEQVTITRQSSVKDDEREENGHFTAVAQEHWPTSPPSRLKEKYVKRFIKKLNEATQRNITRNQANNIQRPQGLQRDIYPQIITGCDIHKGEYQPQQGFSARFQPKSGISVPFDKYVNQAQKLSIVPSFIIGPIGSGKTTLLNGVAKEILDTLDIHTSWTQKLLENCFGCCSNLSGEFDIVYLANIKDIPDLSKGTLAQVIFNPAVTNLTMNEAQHGLQAILEGQIKIVILMDGLDQATWEPTRDDVIGHWDKASTATIFGNILSGRLLSTVPITISSTEHSVACLSESMRPNSISVLVGFSKQDAAELYIKTVGDGANKDWDKLTKTNPKMMYMCLNPMFLTFYMTAKKSSTNVTHECASEVLICMIELLFQTKHTKRKDVADVINKLKPMAFQGSQERRVTFGNEDLTKFGLQSTMMNDLIIKVAGQKSPELKILEGRHRYIFIHQSLQEILSAIHAAEKSFEDFKAFVDEELHKDYWSVVRMFLCGILKNRQIRDGIPSDVFKSEKLEEKCDYLMIKMALQLQSNPSPIQRLDLLVALSEADATDTMRECASALDFSNTLMTHESISLLISVLRKLDHLSLLSLSGCGMDDELLGLLVTSPSRPGHKVKIETLDMRDNPLLTGNQIWRKVFERMSIRRCRLDISPDQGAGGAYKRLLEMVIAGREGGVELECRVSELNLDFDQIKVLSDHDIRLQIGRLAIRTNITRSNFLSLRQFLQRHSVKQCLLDIQHKSKGSHLEFVIQVVESVLNFNSSQLQIESLKTHQSNSRQLSGLTRFDKRLKILGLTIQPCNGQFDYELWARMFDQVLIEKCVILPVKKNCVDIWLKFGKAAKDGNVEELVLVPDRKLGLNYEEIADLSRNMPSEITATIGELKMIVTEGLALAGGDWRDLGKTFQRFRIRKFHCQSYPTFPDMKSFASGLRNTEFRQFRLAWNAEDNIEYFSVSCEDEDQVKIIYVSSGQDRLNDQSYEIGEAIRALRVKDVVFGTIDGTILMKLFLRGLGNARIETLASMNLDFHEVQAIYTQCQVRRLRILTNDNTKMRAIVASRERLRTSSHVINKPPNHGVDEQGSDDRFLTEDQWKEQFGLND